MNAGAQRQSGTGPADYPRPPPPDIDRSPVAIANDHGGYRAKLALLPQLRAWGMLYEDFGSHDEDIVRYPHFARAVCEAIRAGRFSRGILICSTGIGMSIAANKFSGIRAALVCDHYSAMMTRRHNDANVLCLPGRLLGDFQLIHIVGTWLSEGFEGGRHAISLGLLQEIEREQFRAPAD
jgi:ribose 5-phosphate isomerase B